MIMCKEFNLNGLKLSAQEPITPRTNAFLNHFGLQAERTNGFINISPQAGNGFSIGSEMRQAAQSFNVEKDKFLENRGINPLPHPRP